MMNEYKVDHWPMVAIDGRFVTSPPRPAKPEGSEREDRRPNSRRRPAGDGLHWSQKQKRKRNNDPAAGADRVFITGASSGIGAALAREYAARGAILGLLAARRGDALGR